MLVTPLQLANATAALALEGQRFKPHLVKTIEFPTEDMELEILPEINGVYNVKKALNWEHVIKAMENVVHGLRGTAHRIAQGITYRMAGKTGTAQVFGIAQDEEYEEDKISKKLRDHALFMGFAPLEDPKIAIAVIVENGGSGSSTAAPIARKMMDAYLLRHNAQQESNS